MRFDLKTMSRVAMTALAAVGLGGVARAELPKMKTEVAFPNLSFVRPVSLAEPGDGSNLLFVVEQPGVIQSFPNDKGTSDKTVFLDIRKQVNSKGNEEGLLGLAFHPKYKENGEFFVYYSAIGNGPRRSIVSRFKVSKDDPRKADPASEEQVWVSDKDPFENHNGGCVLFGPDGFLYISLGDGGAADDPLVTGQKGDDWFGSILRIDVDHPSGGKKYGIPSDNPAARDPRTFKGWAPEVYCIGLRNVWKFSFDRKDGTLWAGDVGQNKWEMVHIIENGGNYGWSVNEAFHTFKPRQKVNAASKPKKPIVEYPHGPGLDPKRKDFGVSITGGYVYRGKSRPELAGLYVYGDYQTGRIWAARMAGGKLAESGEIVDLNGVKPLNIASFGEDAQGELYICAFDGKIHRLAPAK